MSDERTLVLAMETSGLTGGVALCRGAELIGERMFSEQRRQTAELAPLMRELLAGANLSPDDVDLVAVSIGPGSYTGLRVAVAAAKTFCWALKTPLALVCSLEALAREVDEPGEGWVVACRKAYSGQVYSRFFRPGDSGTLEASGPPEVMTPEALARAIEAPARVIGSGVPALRAAWEGAARGGIEMTAEPEAARPRTVARLALAPARTRREGDDVHAASPVYLRPSAAERRRSETSSP